MVVPHARPSAPLSARSQGALGGPASTRTLSLPLPSHPVRGKDGGRRRLSSVRSAGHRRHPRAPLWHPIYSQWKVIHTHTRARMCRGGEAGRCSPPGPPGTIVLVQVFSSVCPAWPLPLSVRLRGVSRTASRRHWGCSGRRRHRLCRRTLLPAARPATGGSQGQSGRPRPNTERRYAHTQHTGRVTKAPRLSHAHTSPLDPRISLTRVTYSYIHNNRGGAPVHAAYASASCQKPTQRLSSRWTSSRLHLHTGPSTGDGIITREVLLVTCNDNAEQTDRTAALGQYKIGFSSESARN